jgi:hypothetical protein
VWQIRILAQDIGEFYFLAPNMNGSVANLAEMSAEKSETTFYKIFQKCARKGAEFFFF